MGGALGRARRGPAAAVLLLTLLLAPAAAGAQAAAPAVDGEALGLWLDRAAAALDKGDASAARDIAAAALEAEGRDSDLLYLHARASLLADGLLRPVLAELGAALEADRFSRYSRADALALEASLLLRLKRPEESLALLGALAPGRSAEADLARLGDLLALGRDDEALTGFEAARLSWPADGRFASLFFASWKAPPGDRSRRLAAAYLDLALDPSRGDPLLLSRALAFVPERDRRKLALEALRAQKGPVDPLDALRYGLIDGGEALREFFAAGPVLSRSDLEILASLLDGPGLASLEGSLASFTGRVETDADADGYPDASTSYVSGRLAGFSLDADQDGRPELRVSFRYGEAESAAWLPEGGGFGYRWGSWPSLDAAWELPEPSSPELPPVADAAATSSAGSLSPAGAAGDGLPEGADGSPRSWDLVPGLLSWTPLSQHPFPREGSAFVLLDATGAAPPLPAALLGAASELRLKRPDGELLVSMRGGIAQSAELRREGRLIARFVYSRGRPLREDLDQDGDGRFESILALDPASDPADPLVLSFKSDVDGDGVYEYREELLPPYRRTWDLDAAPLPRSDQ